MSFEKYSYSIVVSLLLFTIFPFLSSGTGAVMLCEPIGNKVETIIPQVDCLKISERFGGCTGAYVYVQNYCNEDYILSYPEQSKTIVIVNNDKYIKNYEYYKNLSNIYSTEELLHFPRPILDNTANYKGGDILRRWTVTLTPQGAISIPDNRVTVAGYTYYSPDHDKTFPLLFVVSLVIISFSLAFYFVFRRLYRKKKSGGFLAAVLLFFIGFSLLFILGRLFSGPSYY